MTDQQNGPTDGGKFIDTVDPEDPEYIRQIRRPPDVKEDVAQMDQRQRVSAILNSQAFREELEQLVHEQMKGGPYPTSLLGLQQLSEMFLPQYRFNQGSSAIRAAGNVIPVADIRGVDSLNYSKGEKILRCKVAATYRLVDIFGWSQGINNHITCRISQNQEHFLLNPYGLMYHEVTASSLVKVDMQGEVVDPGSTTLNVNRNTFSLHSAIHAARPDIKAIIHLRTDNAVAVSAMKQGLMPISTEAMTVGNASYYDYMGLLVSQEERDKLARNLGPANKVLFLRNHGVCAMGESIEEAFFISQNVIAACDAQVKLMPIGLDNISLPSEEMQRKTYELSLQAGGAGGDALSDTKKKWRRGEIEFEALMRHLDNCGYRTGYIYHEPLVRRDQRKDRANSDVEVPPTTSSFSYFWEDEKDMSKYSSPLKQHLDRHRKQFKSEWLATPNSYHKEEFSETGTPNPKKITKWVPDSEEKRKSEAILLEDKNQFAPLGADPKELKVKHKEIRKDYYEEKLSAGPQSKILEGMTWEEAQKIKDGHVSGTSDTMIVVGAASKGIIQREHQHNAVVYKTYYAPNPFDSMTEEEVDKYKEEIHNKSKGVGKKPLDDSQTEDVIEPGPDGKLISSDERLQQIRQEEVAQQAHAAKGQPHAKAPIDDDSLLTDMATRLAAREIKLQQVQMHQSGGTYSKSTTTHSQTQREPVSPTTPTSPPAEFSRTKSERYTPQKSRESVNGNEAGSPTKSTSSAEVEPSSKEGSPTKERPTSQESPSKEKKKKKFRMPSFSKKKDKEKK